MRHGILLACLLLIASSAVAGPRGPQDDGCHARGFVGVTSEVPSRRKLERLGYEREGGAFIRSVVGCSAAEAAGILPLDYLVAVDGEETTSDRHFFCLLEDVDPGTEVRVTLLRDGEEVETDLTVGRRSDACPDRDPYPKRGFFGLNDGDTDREPGVVVDVSSGGPVAELGMRDGDRLLRVDGYPVNDWSDISTVKRLIDDVDDVSFEIERDGSELLLRGPIDEAQGDSWSWSYSNDRSHARAEVERAIAEVRREIDDIDFDEIERDVREALEAIDWDEVEEETREATEAAMAAVREAFESERSSVRRLRESNRPATSDLRVELEPLSWAEAPGYATDGLRALGAGSSDAVEDFAVEYDRTTGELAMGFEATATAATKVQVFAPTGREVYAFDLGRFSGRFDDSMQIARNGTGDYTAVVTRDGRGSAFRLRVEAR